MTTYVLGAGASRDVGYPLAKSMGEELFAWMEQQTNSSFYDFPLAAESLRSTFRQVEDIEELLTNMDELVASAKSAALEDRAIARSIASHDKPALIAAIRGWFDEIREKPASSYKLFAENVVKEGDTILSFNYDVSLDRELRSSGLWHLGDGYGFAVEHFQTGSQVKLLKLHGSINWFAILFGGSRGGSTFTPGRTLGTRPAFCDSDVSFLGYSGESDRLFPKRGAAAVPPLILPTRCKQFYFDTSLGREWEDFWDSLWDAAAEALKQSSRIVICGYSLPEVDVRACSMLFRELERKSSIVEVCCGGDTNSIVQRFRDAGFHSEPSTPTYFGEWVRAQSRTS